ncbi:MAG: endopeptidase La [Thiomargarita sp.]|nr:endopeptidase La [Thiomargarita sp.]
MTDKKSEDNIEEKANDEQEVTPKDSEDDNKSEQQDKIKVTFSDIKNLDDESPSENNDTDSVQKAENTDEELEIDDTSEEQFSIEDIASEILQGSKTIIDIIHDDDEDSDKKGKAKLATIKKALPTSLHVLPLANRPFFPHQVIPLIIDNEPWAETIKAVADSPQKTIGLLLVKTEKVSEAEKPEDFYEMGTACRLHRIVHSDSDKLQIVVEGIQRFRIKEWISEDPFMVNVTYYPEDRHEDVEEYKPYVLAIINIIKELLPLNPLYNEELKIFLQRFSPEEPSTLADFSASLTTSTKTELQEILKQTNILHRLEKVMMLLNKELQRAQAQVEIRKQVEEKMQDHQREFFLREQLKAIQKELGIEKDDRTAEIDKFLERLKTLEVPKAVQKRIDEEIDKMSMLETGSPEFSVTRNYLDWLTLMPWGKFSKDKLDIKAARKELDKDHEGLEDVKERIIEFLAVGKLKGSISGTILLLVGPPGVGKTSIGRSVAAAIGREFFRFSVGGIHDEAEIKGHRRTYIGAMPGKFLQAMKEVEYANPVIMLDEIDKIGSSYRGDPASALLEVLDPEQNVDFLDHYLDVRFDLSKVLFICTANHPDTIPAPLLDRMEMIKLSGYITSEKLQIAKKHLLKRQVEKSGLKNKQISINDKTLLGIIENYAREAGVRNLEKQIGTITRKSALKLLEGKKLPIVVNPSDLSDYLGKPSFENEKAIKGVGVVTGLAWTSMGGATLSIEASRIHSYNRGFKLTGQLGDVMKESAEIAYSYLMSQRNFFEIDEDFCKKAFIHLHVPAGATPKDGPSAGITMASAILSLANQQKIKNKIAMTGELTLTGQVLPIGGVREKVIAARRINIYELILPKANKRDFDDLPKNVSEGVTVHFVKEFKDVVKFIW